MKKKIFSTIITGISLCFMPITIFSGCEKNEVVVYTRPDNEVTKEESEEKTTADFSESTTENIKPVKLSDRITTSTLQAPYLPSVLSINDKGIQIYWRQPELSDGYEVFRSYEENGEYYYLSDCHEWSFFDTSFDHDKHYVYYRICNYTEDNTGNRTYSEFTDILTAAYRDELVLSHKQTYLPSGCSREVEALYGWGNAKDIIWNSSNESIATVDDNGLITANNKGTCTISVTSNTLGVTKEMTLTVDRDAPTMLGLPASSYEKDEKNIWHKASPPSGAALDTATIMMVGDLMCMSKYQSEFKDPETGIYDFSECYMYVKELLSSADYTIGNLETILDSAMPYSYDMGRYHYKPNCNAPATFLDALVDAGFDGVVLANNHSADADVHGVLETIRQCDKYNLGRTGMQTGLNEKDRYLLTDVNGIKIGFLSYCTSLNSQDTYWNSDDLNTYQNRYSKEKAAHDIETLKSLGAEYIICYMHWGQKNCFAYNSTQKQMATELANLGVDYIAGSHPHVLQAYEELTTDDGRIVPCIYSLGDFNSNINQIKGNRDTIILKIRLERKYDGSISLTENSFIPCYIYTNVGEGRYSTVPLNYNLTSLTDLQNYDELRERIASSIGSGISEYNH